MFKTFKAYTICLMTIISKFRKKSLGSQLSKQQVYNIILYVVESRDGMNRTQCTENDLHIIRTYYIGTVVRTIILYRYSERGSGDRVLLFFMGSRRYLFRFYFYTFYFVLLLLLFFFVSRLWQIGSKTYA